MILEVNNLCVKRSNKTILRDVGFKINQGEVLGILGFSGSGKSTLLLAIAGLLEYNAQAQGKIIFKGDDISALPAYHRNIPLVLQDLGLFKHLSAVQNVMYPLKIRKIPKEKAEKRAYEELEQLGIKKEKALRKPENLSGGEQQRVALARALAISPSLVMLDEPTSALDTATASDFAEVINVLRRERGFAAIIATHDRTFANSISDRIYILHKGEFIQEGTTAELHHRPKYFSVARLLGLRNLLPVELINKKEGKISIDKTEFINLVKDENVDSLSHFGLLMIREDKAILSTAKEIKNERFLNCFFERELWDSAGRSILVRGLGSTIISVRNEQQSIKQPKKGDPMTLLLPRGCLWYIPKDSNNRNKVCSQ